MNSNLMLVVNQVKNLPPQSFDAGFSLGQQWAMENGLAKEWDEQFLVEPPAAPKVELTTIQKMLLGVEEVSRQFGFELIAVEGFEAPRVNVLRFKPAANTDVTRVGPKFDNVVARVSGIVASPPPVIRIIDGGLEILCARKTWSKCYLKDYVKRKAWQPWEALTIAWGVSVEGRLHELPLIHAQIAGTTGGGKTALMNALLGQVVVRYAPWQVQWLLIDVEQVGLCQFDRSAWFWRGPKQEFPNASICDEAKAYRALELVLVEHDRRLSLLKAQGVDSVERYNRKAVEPLPHLLVVIDECAVFRGRVGAALEDTESSRSPAIVAKEGREAVDALLIEISQRCRKTGIHLIVATQRAAQDSLNPNLRDNLGTKIVLRCNSKGGSMVAFGYDCDWAVRLAGNGDMWVADGADVERCQGLYIDNEELLSNGKTRLEELLTAAAEHQPYIDWLAKQNQSLPQAPQKWGMTSQGVPPNPPKTEEPSPEEVAELCRRYRQILTTSSETAAIVAVFGHLHSNPNNAAAGNSRSKYLRWVNENQEA